MALPAALHSRLGQQQLITVLAAMASRPTVYGHAYLFSGTDDVAVLRLATWYRDYLVCTAPIGENPCGQCSGCTSQNRNDGLWSHSLLRGPDQSTHSADAIRGIRTFTALRQVEAGRRVVFIDGADTLRGPSANALLKVLEEPGERLTFLLTAHTFAAVLPTIRSRTMTVAVQPVPAADLVNMLEHAGHAKKSAAFAAALYPGQVGRALRILEDSESFETLQELDRTLANWARLPRAQRLASAATVLQGYAEPSAQRTRLQAVFSIIAKHCARQPRALRAVLDACMALKTNAQPKLILDALALTLP